MSLSSLVLCLCLSVGAAPPADSWVGEDKLKHFLASFVVTSLSAGGARAAGLDPGASVWVGAGVGAGVGAWKELRDARLPDATFSLRDAAWDLAGIGAASAVMAQVR